MNKKQILYGLATILATSISLSAYSVIIDGTFKGYVINAWDNGDASPFFNDFFSSDVVGKDFKGSFSYDTELAPVNTGTDGQWRASETNKWLGLTFKVDGKTLDISNIPANFTATNSWEALNVGDPSSSTGLHDFTQEYFGLRDENHAVYGDLTSHQIGGISFLEATLPVLNGTELTQDFKWKDTGEFYAEWDDIPGLATYNIDSTLNDKQTEAGLAARITKLTVSARKEANVPEPSSFLLLMLGILSLALRSYKLNK